MDTESILNQMRCNDVPVPPLPLDTSGKKVVYGPKKKAWYRIHEWTRRSDNSVHYGGVYGYKSQDNWFTIEVDFTEFTPEEKAQYAKDRAAKEKAEADKRKLDAERAANRAKDQWEKASPTGTSEYLTRKGVKPVACRFMDDGKIIVPLLDYSVSPARLVGSQKISPDGTKEFNSGMIKAGAACRIGPESVDGDAIYLAEGYATALSVHECFYGHTVYMCCDAGNLLLVAKILRKRYPNSTLVFCADDDYLLTSDGKENHAGKIKADKAAAEVGNAFVILPVFNAPRRLTRDDESLPALVDFNDLHKAEGVDAVRASFGAALEKAAKEHFATRPVPEVVSEAIPEVIADDSPAPLSELTQPDSGEDGNISPDADKSSAEAGKQEGTGGVDKHFEYLLRNIALIAGKTRVFDKGRGLEMTVTALRMAYGKAAVGKWLECDAKQVIEGADLVKKKRQIDRENKESDLTFQGVLSRYVLLDGTDSIFDIKLHQTISQSALKLAIGEAFPEWVNHPDRRVIPHKNMVFDPTNRVNNETHINLFRGLPLEPEYNASLKCLPIQDLIAHLVNHDDAAFDWLCKWLAYPLQMRTTGGKMDTAVLMHGDEQGSGKSLFFELCYKPIFGDYAATLSQHQLDSQYTAWRSSKLFCLFEEVLANNQKYSHTGTLKQMITGKTQQIERKFVDAWEEANYLNAVFLSNALQPFHLEAKDRRFLVIWPEKTLPEKEQRRVEDALANGGVEAFYGWLMEYNIDGFTPHTKPPMTPAKQRLIDHGLATWEVFFRDWKAGDLGVPYGAVPTAYLFSVYSQWCEKGREGKPLSLHRFSTTIHAKMHKALEHYRFGSNDGKSSPQRMFFYPKEGDETPREKKPDGMTKQNWFGLSAFKFKEAAGISSWNTEGWD